MTAEQKTLSDGETVTLVLTGRFYGLWDNGEAHVIFEHPSDHDDVRFFGLAVPVNKLRRLYGPTSIQLRPIDEAKIGMMILAQSKQGGLVCGEVEINAEELEPVIDYGDHILLMSDLVGFVELDIRGPE